MITTRTNGDIEEIMEIFSREYTYWMSRTTIMKSSQTKSFSSQVTVCDQRWDLTPPVDVGIGIACSYDRENI